MRQVLAPVPAHHRQREQVSLGKGFIRRRVEAAIGDRIDQQLVTQLDSPGRCLLCQHGGEVAAGAVPGHGNARAVATDEGSVRYHPFQRGQRIFVGRREACLGRQPVVHGHDQGARAVRQAAADVVMPFHWAEDETAPVEVQRDRHRPGRLAAGPIETQPQGSAGAVNHSILDGLHLVAGCKGRRAVEQCPQFGSGDRVVVDCWPYGMEAVEERAALRVQIGHRLYLRCEWGCQHSSGESAAGIVQTADVGCGHRPEASRRL